MEIKILCPCGAKFKFQVEPINGQSPGPVHCPSCGKDSTEETNALIRQQLAGAPAAPAVAPPAPRISVSIPAAPTPAVAATASGEAGPKVAIPAVRIPAAPISVSAQPAAAPIHVSFAAARSPAPAAAPAPIAPNPAQAAPVAAVGPKMTVMPVPETSKSLSVKPPSETTAHETSPSAAPANASGDPKTPGSPKMAFMPAPVAGTGKTLSVSGHGKADEKPAEAGAATATPEPARAHPAAAKMVKSAPVSGGIRLKAGYTGAIIGAILGMTIWYFVVISTGREVKWLAVLVGLCTAWGARLLGGGKHGKLATASGWSAIVAILLGQFLAIQHIKAEFIDDLIEESYKDRIALARDAAAAKTDKEIRAIMVKDEKAEYSGKAAESISEDDLVKYRTKELAALQKFANGSPSRTQYEAQIRKEIEDSGAGGYEFRIVTIIWIAAGVGAAWKIVKPPEKE